MCLCSHYVASLSQLNIARHLDLAGRQMEALSQEQLEMARRQIDLVGRPPLFGLGGQKYF